MNLKSTPVIPENPIPKPQFVYFAESFFFLASKSRSSPPHCTQASMAYTTTTKATHNLLKAVANRNEGQHPVPRQNRERKIKNSTAASRSFLDINTLITYPKEKKKKKGKEAKILVKYGLDEPIPFEWFAAMTDSPVVVDAAEAVKGKEIVAAYVTGLAWAVLALALEAVVAAPVV
jgi:hypothetical protein